METTTALSGRKQIMTVAIGYILVSVIAGAIGQITLKYGMTLTGQITLSAHDIVPTLFKIFTNPFIIGGLALYVGGTVFWLAALSRVDHGCSSMRTSRRCDWWVRWLSCSASF